MRVGSRRRFLRWGAVTGLGGVAGCLSGSGDQTPASETPTKNDRRATPDDTPVESASNNFSKLTADDGDKHDQFGGSVAIDGTTILVGAINDEDPNGTQAGSAYVFEQSDGTWSQQAKLAPESVGEGGGFANRVGLSGDTALLTSAKGLHRYIRSGGDWTEKGDPTLNSIPGMGPFTTMGDSVLYGQFCTGTSTEGFSTAPVYEFTWSDGQWTQTGQIVPENPDSVECFGEQLDGADNTVAISAIDRDVPMAGEQRSGVVYLFEKSNNSWNQTTRLTPDQRVDFFGSDVAVTDDIVAISSLEPSESNGAELGTVYAFDRIEGTKLAKLTIEEFGRLPGLATNGEQVLFGDWFNNAVYAFGQSDATWKRQAELVPSDIDSRDEFGASIAVDGTTVVIGAHLDEDPNGPRSGSAYVVNLD